MSRFADQGCATLAYGDAKRVELALRSRRPGPADGRARRNVAARASV
jgi:hypothetical protein